MPITTGCRPRPPTSSFSATAPLTSAVSIPKCIPNRPSSLAISPHTTSTPMHSGAPRQTTGMSPSLGMTNLPMSISAGSPLKPQQKQTQLLTKSPLMNNVSRTVPGADGLSPSPMTKSATPAILSSKRASTKSPKTTHSSAMRQ